VSNFKAS